jgi:YesN/AraC family two-component response regulator
MTIKRRRVLIVEDEELIRELFYETLTRRNHVVDLAENGRIGFRKATTFDFDVILFDLHMPEWNGVDSIKGILLVKPKSRFLVVSAYADRKIADDLRMIPEVLAVLLKPADINDIVTYVESV